MTARRAVMRWAWRMFRREWRQQALVLALLTAAVAAAVAGMTVIYNTVPPRTGEYGTADHRLRLDGADPRKLQAALAESRRHFGTIDVISHGSAPVPGSVDGVELRAQDPQGPYGKPMLRLLDGRYPRRAGEVALTDVVAKTFRVSLGARFSLDGRERTVVGLVENPGNLHEEFVLAPDVRPVAATVLVGGSREHARRLNESVGGSFTSPREGERTAAASAMLVLSVALLLLVTLIAAAGFVVTAQRRLRQLGMLAAVGGTDRQLRLVTVANGLLVGVIAALAGSLLGLGGWFVAAPWLEAPVEHRIDRLDIPWLQIALGMLLAVVMAAGSAWWPARIVSRVPITLALSARPPRPKPARRSALAAVPLLAAGLAALSLAPDRESAPLFIVGVLGTAIGTLLLAPLTVKALSAVLAARLPVASRLALRDLSRHQFRSAAALAAISLALGISVTVVAVAAAAQPAADEGNLSDRQLVVSIGNLDMHLIPERTPAQLAGMRKQVEQFAATLSGGRAYLLQRPLEPGAPKETGDGRLEGGLAGVGLAVPRTSRFFEDQPYYVATPELLSRYGLTSLSPDVELVTRSARDYRWISMVEKEGDRDNPPRVSRLHVADLPEFSSAPTRLATPEALRRKGWRPAPVGWFIEAQRPLTTDQRDHALDMARAAGLHLETRHDNSTVMSNIRTGATVAGLLLALGILAMTVGLIRGESGRDLRTLTATGATGGTRRSLSATTAGSLALLGALLGTAGAYAALIAGYWGELGELDPVPVPHLAMIVCGLPMLALGSAWLLSGREPAAINRQPIE